MRPEVFDPSRLGPGQVATRHFSVEGTDLGVRRALLDLECALRDLRLPADAAGNVLLVLAEVLNNVVEHAFAEKSGKISVKMRPGPGHLAFCVCDTGCVMPGNALPPRPVLDHSCPLDSLPEGGFGWHLIHVLTRDLTYRRVDGVNRLRFSVPC